MAPLSSGKKDRPRKLVKKGTASSRKHRFESFNQRIGKINIDPVRRVRRDEIDQEDSAATASYFRTSLDYWKDINLSENFTAFVKEVSLRCGSLPQILHSHQEILDTLVIYLERGDTNSLEPLLSLVGHLAHDLGARFEVHFARTVRTVSSLATRHHDVEIIEWSFTCLAWLFKYLSRLLVPDLRPLYDIMAPLLGKETQKTHIARFAAESMSFLIRKAGLMYHKNAKSLVMVIRHIFEDLDNAAGQKEDVVLFQTGLMTMFADAIKGIKREIHSCGSTIYSCLLEGLLRDQSRSSSCQEVFYGITVNLIHHSEVGTFGPIVQVILDRFDFEQHPSIHAISVYGRLFFLVTAVRKGSRISNWKPMVDSAHKLLRRLNDIPEDEIPNLAIQIHKTAAIILQYAPLDIVISTFGQIMDIISKRGKGVDFLFFCNYYSDLGRERYDSLLAPYFFR